MKSLTCKRCGVVLDDGARDANGFHSDRRCATILLKKVVVARDALALAQIHLEEWAAAGNVHARRDVRKIRTALRHLRECGGKEKSA